MEGRKKMATLIDQIKVLEEMLGIMFQQGQESAYYDDKIEIGAMTYSDVEYENGKSDGMDIAYNMIADAPEIKAIPIEWIEKWLDKITGTRDGEDISQLPEQLKFAIEMINLMEMEWEKENADTN